MLHGKIITAGYIKKYLEVLRDKDNLLPEVKEYLEEENKYTDHHLEIQNQYKKYYLMRLREELNWMMSPCLQRSYL